jgi:hypothetical protein
VVGVGSAVGSWVGGATTLTCLSACLLVGGFLYRRLEKPLAPAPGDPAMVGRAL